MVFTGSPHDRISSATAKVIPFKETSNTVIQKATVDVADVVEENLVPLKDETFVEWGNISDIKKVLKSKKFYPIAITGHSGNGKTFGVEQTCARLSRECIRVNFTVETDEDDLLGHYILKDGVTTWVDGSSPNRDDGGAVLLLDEYDLASTKIMGFSSLFWKVSSLPQEDQPVCTTRTRVHCDRNCEHKR